LWFTAGDNCSSTFSISRYCQWLLFSHSTPRDINSSSGFPFCHSSAPLPVEPNLSAPVATKHEYEKDADVMTEEDQRPAKRARTAEISPTSIANPCICTYDHHWLVTALVLYLEF
jgi:hypothetical protein